MNNEGPFIHEGFYKISTQVFAMSYLHHSMESYLLSTNRSRTSCCFQVFGHSGSHRHDLDTRERAGGFWDWGVS